MTRTIDIKPVMELDLGSRAGQLRAAPVSLGPPDASPRAYLAAYCADFDVDPWHEMFFSLRTPSS